MGVRAKVWIEKGIANKGQGDEATSSWGAALLYWEVDLGRKNDPVPGLQSSRWMFWLWMFWKTLGADGVEVDVQHRNGGQVK
jgi:hypothetical protein